MKCHKYTEMALLTSRNANKHVLLALGVNRTARDTMNANFTGVPTHSLATYTIYSVMRYSCFLATQV